MKKTKYIVQSSKEEVKAEEDLLAKNQRLKTEIEYLKNKCLSTSRRAKEQKKAFIISELRQKYSLKDLLKL